MAGTNRYELAKDLIKKLKAKFETISIATLKQYISIYLGSDEKRCIIPYLKLMQDSGLIKEIGVNTWELHDEGAFDL